MSGTLLAYGDKVIGALVKSNGYVQVVADGTKTYSQLLSALYALIDSSKVSADSYVVWELPNSYKVFCRLGIIATGKYDVASVQENNIVKFSIRSSASTYYLYSMANNTNTNNSSSAVQSGTTFTFYY